MDSETIEMADVVKGRSSARLGQPLQLGTGDIVPVACVIEGRHATLSFPLGAYVAEEGKIRFRPTVDVVGLSAALAGIFVGWRVGVAALRALGATLAR